ncbi:MAG: gyrase subunit A protein [Microgenomates group bacterium GW2011_GWA1_48_10]|nr:MAG: gyrase subunit A protein [Microgenomates group bacterium GW2011_GWA1_48_10]
MEIGKILPSEITSEMQSAYLDYAMSVIVARALPDSRDGLKPVHRRIIYAMHKVGLHHTAKYQKSAAVVGEVLKNFHPHGDIPVYDALVRMAQDFSLRYPLIDGQGNFGSMDGDPPAAMRYTEARLAAISDQLLLDMEKETVDFVSNYSNTDVEPTYLPALLPNLLLMGADGIAVGMATKIPPHNLGEVIDALVLMIDKGIGDNVTVEDLCQFIKGPDFPTGGIIYDHKEILAAYGTGKGKIVIRAKTDIEDVGGGKSAIIVSEIPYQVNKAELVARIADLVKDKKIDGISDLRDESDRRGVRVYIELKRDARPQSVLNNLFKHTSLQISYPVNIVALVDQTPQTLTLKMILEEYLQHRQNVVRRRSEFELKEAKARQHILEGLKIAVDHIDEVISIIRKSESADVAKGKLMDRFKLTDIQATAILDMQLRRLAALERQKIEDELAMVRETIAYLEDLLAHPEKILKVIRDELLHLKEKFGDPRRTKVIKGKVGEFSEEDLIANESMIVTVTKTGYIKRLSPASYRAQARGGKGVTGMTTKEEDEIDHLTTANTHDNILFFTNSGKVYQTRVFELPEGSRQAKGQAVVNLINTEQGEIVQSILAYDTKLDQLDKFAKYIFLTTKQGTVKKSPVTDFANIRKNGLTAIKLEAGDELVWARFTTGSDDILLVTHEGKSIRFPERQVKPQGRDTIGVRGIKLGKNDFVVGMESVPSSKPNSSNLPSLTNGATDLLVVSEKGVGKRTAVSQFPLQGRGGQGVKAMQITTKTGNLVTARLVDDTIDQLILTSAKGIVIKLPLISIPKLSRATQGVILMRFSETTDRLAAVTTLEK